MALMSYPTDGALVRTPVPDAMLPLDLRVLDAESTVEAAEAIWRMRSREFDARPSAEARRRAGWAAEDLREAGDALASLRAEMDS